MAVRNAVPHTTNAWRGLNSFISRNNIDEQSWVDANNVLVNARGEAEVLRSPKAFGNTLATDDSCCSPGESDPCSEEATPIVSMDEFQRTSGNALIIDRGEESVYLLAAGGDPTVVKVGNLEGAAWTSLSIADTFQRINGTEFVQFLNSLTQAQVYRNGIDPPLAAPVLSYVANASDTTVVATGIFGSYSYMNSTTGHVSAPSPLSNTLGAKAAGFSINVTVQASLQYGVDKIVFFLTVDGGNIPYLVVDCSNGDTHLVTNANATYQLTQKDVTRDTLTPEPIYNVIPPTTATSMFGWKDRIFLVVDGGLQYSGFETTYIGNTYESWPTLNQLNVPNRNDRAIGGISTQSGALIFGEKDCYLISGFPSDKASSPNNAIAVTEHVDPMNWNIGITYPETAVNTPFGVIWTDNTKRIRMWNQTGFPQEIGQPLRTELDTMTAPLKARWFQHGKNGGYYVVTDGTTVLFLMLYVAGGVNTLLTGQAIFGQLQTGYGKSTSLAPDAMATVTFNDVERFFYAADDQVQEILDPSLAGDGWDEGTEIFFRIVIGNDKKQMNFSSLHSMQCSGSLEDIVVTQARLNAAGNELDPEVIVLDDDLEADTGGTLYGLIDSDERRYHSLKFAWGIEDTVYRNLDSFTLNVKNSRRMI